MANDLVVRTRNLTNTEAGWKANDLVLGNGEIGVEEGPAARLKIGDGVRRYSQLQFIVASSGPAGETPSGSAGGFLAGSYPAPVFSAAATLSWAQVSGKPSTFPPTHHTHSVSDITDLPGGGGAAGAAGGDLAGYYPDPTIRPEVIDDRVAALLVPGANITLAYDDVANTLTIASSGGSGGGGIPDVPMDNKYYGRRNTVWTDLDLRYPLLAHSHPYLLLTGGTLTGSLTIDGGASSVALALQTNSGVPGFIDYRTGSLSRWFLGKSTDNETGANAGANFWLRAYDDAGAAVGNVFEVNRSTRILDFRVWPTITVTPLPTTASTTQIATTAWVKSLNYVTIAHNHDSLYAPLSHSHVIADLPPYPTTLPPSGAAGGVLSGTYPSPGFANAPTFVAPVNISGVSPVPLMIERVAASSNIAMEWRNGSGSWFGGMTAAGDWVLNTSATIGTFPKILITAAGLITAGASPAAGVAANEVVTALWVNNKGYQTVGAANAAYAPIVHTHAWADITSGVPATFPPSAHTQLASTITDFSEAVDDRVAVLIVGGSNITATYNDVANTLTIAAATYPTVPTSLPPNGPAGGALAGTYPNPTLSASASLGWTQLTGVPATFPPSVHNHDLVYAPISHTQTAATITDFAEAVDDRVALLVVGGTNITATYNDVANTLTIAAAAYPTVPSSLPPSGTAGGALAGTYPSPTLSATASLGWTQLTGVPATFPPSAHNHDTVYAPIVHTHSYLPLTGGTVNGTMIVGSAGRGLVVNVSGGNMTTADVWFNDNSATGPFRLINAGLTGVGQGMSLLYGFGIAGAVDASAASITVLTTDTWATAANRSSRMILQVSQAGGMASALDLRSALAIFAGAVNAGVATAVGAVGNELTTASWVIGKGYQTVTAANAAYAPIVHTHPQSDIVNLVSDLALKASLASPALTGTPTAPTPATADSSTTLATTAYVKAQVEESVAFTPTLAFATPGTSSFAYTAQIGHYQKIGNWVSYFFAINFTPTIGTGTGQLRIALPFPSAQEYSGSISTATAPFIWPAGALTVGVRAVGNQSYAAIYSLKSASATVDFTSANLTDAAAHVLRGTIRYKVV